MQIEKLFRWALITTFFTNMAATLTFIPAFRVLREPGSLPEAGNPFYAWLLALWIFLFGQAYLWLAFSKTRQSLFVLMGALGKSSFAVLLATLAFFGEIPTCPAFSGLGDLLIAVIFFVWLVRTKGEAY